MEAEKEKVSKFASRRAPSQNHYNRLLAAEADDSGLDRDKLLRTKSRTRAYVRARWRVWHRLARDGYTINSIASRAGFDHQAVHYGVLRLQAIERAGYDPYRVKGTALAVKGASVALYGEGKLLS